MRIQLIRNATLRIDYAGHQFIVDPFLAEKHVLPSFAGKSPNPLVDLPMPAHEVIQGIEMAIVSHLHGDHFDALAAEMLPKDLPIFCQPAQGELIREKGFSNVTAIGQPINWQGVTITPTPGQHGQGEVLQQMGAVIGFILRAADEPCVYWAGDTIYYEAVGQIITDESPDIIITHSCGAVWGDGGLIVMDAAQTIAVCRAAPQATVIAVHMEALDHATVSRAELRAFADEHGVTNLCIPDDGELMEF